MDETLLAVGRWTDDKAQNKKTTMWPHKSDNEMQHRLLSTESRSRASRSTRKDYTGLTRPSHHNRPSRSEDELLSKSPKTAMKEVRASQLIRRQHPACFEGSQQGNEATAKPSAASPRWSDAAASKPAPTYHWMNTKVWKQSVSQNG
jgi:hypothetical protein